MESQSDRKQSSMRSMQASAKEDYKPLTAGLLGLGGSSLSLTSQFKANNSAITGLDLSIKNLAIFADLVSLNLSHNSFSGLLPAGIFNLTNLTTLDISRNNFSGHFPTGFSALQNLIVLNACSNSFSGSLPRRNFRPSEPQNPQFSRKLLPGTDPVGIRGFPPARVYSSRREAFRPNWGSSKQ